MKRISSSAPCASRGALAVAVAALALAGCANYSGISSDKQLTAPESLESTQSLPAQGGQWPSFDWATQFGDPQLPQLIDEALAGSPSIAQAQARIGKASSYIESSRSSLYPKVTGQYSWTRELYSANALFPPPYGGTWYSENNALVSATWELDLWGKNRARLNMAVSQEKSAEADMQQARVTLAASVARTYNQLALLYALRDVAQREIANRDNVGRITNGRVTAGLDTNVERRTAEGNIATSQSNLTELDGQITTVRYQLGALLGKGPDRGLQIAKPVVNPQIVISLPDNVPADLVSRRPDIVAARWQVEAATQNVKEAKAEFFPDINLAAAFGFDAFGWSKFLTASSRQIQAGPAIHLPIFDAGYLRSQLKGRYADFDLDIANYNQTLINALNDVATQVAAIRSLDRQMGDAERALDAATHAYDLAVIRYKAGLSPQLQVLSADENRLANEQTVTNLKMRRRDLQIGLIKALGGGFDATGTNFAIDGSGQTQAANAAPAK
ncbi:RND efflux system outer membrane lipoprotein [Caballeronia arationis]|uniref:Efflux transporter, outer membrane factor (OMF) lipoprotein, NodT family n=1 Tax=Caballeronia arationis TaxID=1777142 RepID=A0A7Z7N438_9BURK|nr:efflux transporter outer membrane subunit [Caballeronia arationis]SAK74774.1 RND efflux system outer membrane lipoprotein [Caballeronia arationis]SOE81430.1 efflux transporter, outer membrane factor (OMF) lipoprotein, NodT family [Caballeronia arationis]